MALLIVPWTGCKDLPNPETDEVARVLRLFDRMQRPGGGDTPLEGFFGWTSERDTGLLPATDVTEHLQGLVDAQRGLVAQIKRIRTTSDAALGLLDAYLAAHIAGNEAMEEVLAARRLGDSEGERAAEAGVRTAHDELRAARAHRAEVEKRLGVVLPPRKP